MQQQRRRPLYVRLPSDAAEKLDRAAFELRTSKQDLVTELVSSGLPGPGRVAGATRRVVVEAADPDALTVGHHSFAPSDAPEVLTAAEVAELLRSDEGAVERMAADGELPGRRVAGEWRFSRSAILRWLGSSDEED